MPPLPVWPHRADAVLREVAPAELAVDLWVQLRHLRDWLTPAPDGAATELFHPSPSARVLERRAHALASAPDGSVAKAIGLFHALTDEQTASHGEIARGCVAVADWALISGYGETAMQFSAAAARAEPLDARTLNAAGLMHRRGGEWMPGELYYQRAAYCARQHRDSDELVGANIGLAALWSSRRQTRRARRHLDRATDVAQRSGSAWLAAHA